MPLFAKEIRRGDYVTLSLKFAKNHAVTSAIYNGEPFQVAAKTVSESDIVPATNPGEYIFQSNPVNVRTPIYVADEDGNIKSYYYYQKSLNINLENFIKDEVSNILLEVKISDVIKRLSSKPFLKAYARNLNVSYQELKDKLDQLEKLGGALGENPYSVLEDNALSFIPNDISDSEKGEALNWIVNQYISGSLPHRLFTKETLVIGPIPHEKSRDKYRRSLEHFFHWRRFYTERNLSVIKNIEMLTSMRQEARLKIEEYEENQASKDWEKGTNFILKTNKWTVLIPENKAAACYWGKGTKWCTRFPKLDYYDQYHSEDDPLFIIINKNNPKEKYQFSFGHRQFMNYDDKSIDYEDIFIELITLFISLIKKYPVIKEYFKDSLLFLIERFDKDIFKEVLKQLDYEDIYEKIDLKFKNFDINYFQNFYENAQPFYRYFLIYQSSPEVFMNFIRGFSELGFYISEQIVSEIEKRILKNEISMIEVFEILINNTKRGTEEPIKGIFYRCGSSLSSSQVLKIINILIEKLSNNLITTDQFNSIFTSLFKRRIGIDEEEIIKYIFSKENTSANLSAKILILKNISIYGPDYEDRFIKIIKTTNDNNSLEKDEGLEIIIDKMSKRKKYI